MLFSVCKSYRTPFVVRDHPVEFPTVLPDTERWLITRTVHFMARQVTVPMDAR